MLESNNWGPSQITRIVDFLPTSTKPIKAETDEGTALIKYIGNPQGCDALVAEFVAGSLAKAVGIPVPDFAIVQCPEVEIERFGITTTAGPAFASKWVPDAMSLAPGSELLANLRNTDLVTALVAFDTWIRNFDRFLNSGAALVSNLDNVLFVPDVRKSALVVIDHTHAFVSSTFDDELEDPNWWDDQTIYGSFPDFEPFLSHKVLMNVLDKIRSVDMLTLEEIVEGLPVEWELTHHQRSLFVDQLLKRAKALPTWLPEKLFAQGELF